MADIKSTEERSWNMSRIHGENTKPEEYIRKKLFARGYRYRKNYDRVVGKPDIWMPKYKTALFVNGCFWHRHQNCRYAYMPKSNTIFWKEKFEVNIQRDIYVKDKLISNGVKVLVIWECTIKRMNKNADIERCILESIDSFLNDKSAYMEL